MQSHWRDRRRLPLRALALGELVGLGWAPASASNKPGAVVRCPPMLTRGERRKDEFLITVDGSTLHWAMVTGDAEPLADGTGVGP